MSTTRDFTFVEDTCRGFLAVAAMEGGAGDVFNIGSNTEVSVAELVALAAEVMGMDARPVQQAERLRPEASEVLRLCCDNSKLSQATGFTPMVPLRDGLAATATWFRKPENLVRYKGHLYNV